MKMLVPIRFLGVCLVASSALAVLAAGCGGDPSPAPASTAAPAELAVPTVSEGVKEAVKNAPDLDTAVQLLSEGNLELERRLKEHQRTLETTEVVKPAAHREYLIWRAEVEGQAIAEYSSAQEHFEAGRRLEGKGYAVEAREQYAKAVAKDPQLALAHAGLGRTAFQMADNQAAAEAFEQAISLAPGRPGWVLELGECYYAMNDDERAREQFEKALELKPHWPLAHTRLGTVYWRTQDFEAANEHLSEAIELGGDPEVALVNLVRSELGLEPWDGPKDSNETNLVPAPDGGAASPPASGMESDGKPTSDE